MRVIIPIAAALLMASAPAVAGQAQDQVIAAYAAAAKAADPNFGGFDAARGKTFFLGQHTGGKPDTPSCTTCHTDNPKKPGRTRAGKDIAPMAVSVTADRFSDPAKVEKWLVRNCSSVLGRECTATEKGDIITWLSQQ